MGIADDDGGLGVGLDGLGEGREGPEQIMKGGMNSALKKKRKPYNYALERWVESGGDGTTGPKLWEQVKEGFVSPEQALEYPVKIKLQGTFRAVRIASDSYEVALITPEPIVKMSKVKERRKS